MPLDIEATKDHDLLVRLDEKMDGIGKTLTALVTSIDQRGVDIEELKTAKLLHEQETKQQEKELEALRTRIASVETSVTQNKKIVDANIEIIKDASIMLWMQKHPKIAWIAAITFLIMLNFHDIIVPWVFSLFGYHAP